MVLCHPLVYTNQNMEPRPEQQLPGIIQQCLQLKSCSRRHQCPCLSLHAITSSITDWDKAAAACGNIEQLVTVLPYLAAKLTLDHHHLDGALAALLLSSR